MEIIMALVLIGFVVFMILSTTKGLIENKGKSKPILVIGLFFVLLFTTSIIYVVPMAIRTINKKELSGVCFLSLVAISTLTAMLIFYLILKFAYWVFEAEKFTSMTESLMYSCDLVWPLAAMFVTVVYVFSDGSIQLSDTVLYAIVNISLVIGSKITSLFMVRNNLN